MPCAASPKAPVVPAEEILTTAVTVTITSPEAGAVKFPVLMLELETAANTVLVVVRAVWELGAYCAGVHRNADPGGWICPESAHFPLLPAAADCPAGRVSAAVESATGTCPYAAASELAEPLAIPVILWEPIAIAPDMVPPDSDMAPRFDSAVLVFARSLRLFADWRNRACSDESVLCPAMGHQEPA